MSRDHKKLTVFALADELVLAVYSTTAMFPDDERYGLCKQLRRAAVSVPANIVEGCARRTTRDYLHFINLATGSAAETLYLLDLSARLNFVRAEVYREFDAKYSQVLKQLQAIHKSLDRGL